MMWLRVLAASLTIALSSIWNYAIARTLIQHTVTTDVASGAKVLSWIATLGSSARGLEISCILRGGSRSIPVFKWRGSVPHWIAMRRVVLEPDAWASVGSDNVGFLESHIGCEVKEIKSGVLKFEWTERLVGYEVLPKIAGEPYRIRVRLEVVTFGRPKSNDVVRAQCAIYSFGKFSEVVEFDAATDAEGQAKWGEIALSSKSDLPTGLHCLKKWPDKQ